MLSLGMQEWDFKGADVGAAVIESVVERLAFVAEATSAGLED